MSDLRYIAERWLAEYGPETPVVVRGWAAQLTSAPTAAQFLSDIADVVDALLAEHDAPAHQRPPAPGTTQS
jgi:hypothetical protein